MGFRKPIIGSMAAALVVAATAFVVATAAFVAVAAASFVPSARPVKQKHAPSSAVVSNSFFIIQFLRSGIGLLI